MIKLPTWLPVVMVLVTACTDTPTPSAPVASARLARELTEFVQTTYAYDASGRLVSEQYLELLRPTDPYGYNWGRRYTYDVPGQLRSTNMSFSGNPFAEWTNPLNSKGFAINTENTYDADGYLIKDKNNTQTVANGDVVKRVLKTSDFSQTVFTYLHDITRLNTLPDPTYFTKGTPDRHLLTGEIRETTHSQTDLLSYSKEVISYTYAVDSQGKITKRCASTLRTQTTRDPAHPDQTYVDKPIGTLVTQYFYE